VKANVSLTTQIVISKQYPPDVTISYLLKKQFVSVVIIFDYN